MNIFAPKPRGAFTPRRSLLTLICVCFAVALIAPLAIPKANAQLTPTTRTNLAGLPAVGLAAGTATNLNHILTIPQGKVLQVTHTVAGAGASTDKVFLYYAISSDGTNFATTAAGHINFLSWTLSGTTGQCGNTNIPAAFLEGASKIKFTVYTNHSAVTVYPSNITVTWRN